MLVGEFTCKDDQVELDGKAPSWFDELQFGSTIALVNVLGLRLYTSQSQAAPLESIAMTKIDAGYQMVSLKAPTTCPLAQPSKTLLPS